MDKQQLCKILEAALMAYDKPLSVDKLALLFIEKNSNGQKNNEDIVQLSTVTGPKKADILAALQEIQSNCENRGFELKEVSSGWRFQVREDTSYWVNKLWEEKPQKYSRALLETLAIIAYRQPITRGEIEDIRGVAVSSPIIQTLTEREWIKIVGHRDTPGKPSLLATTRQFLDYFNLQSLEHLPSLRDLTEIDNVSSALNIVASETVTADASQPVSSANAENHAGT